MHVGQFLYFNTVGGLKDLVAVCGCKWIRRPESGGGAVGELQANFQQSFGFSPLDTLLKGTVPRNAFAFTLFVCKFLAIVFYRI